MAKKNWWVKLLKNLFTCESQTKTEKVKVKKWRSVFDKFRLKQLPTTSQQQNSLRDAKEEQRKHALNVAKATAAAADAALAAAQAAAEVVRLTNVSRSCLKQPWRGAQNLAAIKIQTAFRAYLARKALRALKGVVRIQAIARGKAVRRRVSKELKHSRSHSLSIHQAQVIHTRKLHSRIHSGSYEIGEETQSCRANNDIDRSKLECKSQRQWRGRLFSKEDIKSFYIRQHDSALRRERMKQYSFSHRERQNSQMLEETMPLRHERHTCVRKKWGEDNVYSKGYTALNIHSDTRIDDLALNLRVKPRNLLKEMDFLEEVNSPFSCPRRSLCHMKLRPNFDETQLTSSPSLHPTYMAFTESAKAKMRSMSTPRQRGGNFDSGFEYGSPCKSNRLHPWSCFSNGESTPSSALWRTDCSQCKSSSMETINQ